MEQLLPGIVAEVLKYGAPGLVIAYLVLQNWRRDADHRAALEKIEAVQERRVEEARQSIKALGEMASALDRLSETSDGLSKSVSRFEQYLIQRGGRRG